MGSISPLLIGEDVMARARWLLIIVAFLMFGCDNETSGRKSPKSGDTKKFDAANFSTYRPEDVLVQVGTNTLTRRDVDRLIDLRMRTLRFLLPAAQREGAVSRVSVQVSLLSNAVGAFRAQTAMRNWAATNGVTVSRDLLAKLEKQFMRNCKATDRDFRQFLSRFTPEEIKTLRERIYTEAICAKVRERFIADHPDQIKPIDTAKFLKYLADYNVKAEATNVVIWARATNLWNRAKKGADFAKLANKYTEDSTKPEGGEWGTFRMSDLAGDGQLDRVVASLKPGEVSAPVVADNGLNIIKLVACFDARGNAVESAANVPGGRYQLARIFLRLPEIFDIPSAEEASGTLRKKAEDDAFLKFLNDLMAADKVIYPHGEGVFDTAKKMSKMPMMFQQEGMDKVAK